MPTSSEKGGSSSYEVGKYAVKLYTIDGILIYQTESGSDNTNQIPKGGVILQTTPTGSMDSTILNPITYYGSDIVINQAGHSGDLYNYYWTSYSRGTDGRYISGGINDPSWHNVYLDGYIPLRVKSIYDPCPYLYRIPSNGTWNQFNMQTGWTNGSYLGGASWNLNTLGESWLSGLGYRGSSIFGYTGGWGFYYSGTTNSQTNGYAFFFSCNKEVYPNRDNHPHSDGQSVRCIEVASNRHQQREVGRRP